MKRNAKFKRNRFMHFIVARASAAALKQTPSLLFAASAVVINFV